MKDYCGNCINRDSRRKTYIPLKVKCRMIFSGCNFYRQNFQLICLHMSHDEDLRGCVPFNEYQSCCLVIHFGSLVFRYVGKDSCTKNTLVKR